MRFFVVNKNAAYLKYAANILESNLVSDVRFKLGDRNTNLLHSVAVTNGNAAVGLGLKVVGYAKRGTDLVLTAITLTDRTGFVEVGHEVLRKLGVNLHSLIGELLGEGKYRNLEGRDSGMEAHYDAGVVLLCVDNFLVICFNKKRESHTVSTERGLDNVGDITLVGFGIEVSEILAGMLDVLGEVVVGSVGNAPKFAPAEREEVLEVGGCLGIEGKLLGLVVAKTEVFFFYVKAEKPIVAIASPILEPLKVGVGLAEELKLHLLKLANTEDEVTGRDLVAEGLTNLANTEGKLAACSSLNSLEVYEYTLCGFGTEVNFAARILGNTLMSLEHKVKLTDIGKIGLAAAGTGYVIVANVSEERLTVHSLNVNVGYVVFAYVVLNELVRSVAHLACLAVDKRIVKGCNVTGSHPNLGVHKNSRVKTYVVGILLNKLFPPSALDVVFHLNAERTVVPRVCKSAIDLRAGEDESACLTKRDDFVHCFFCVFHSDILLYRLSGW